MSNDANPIPALEKFVWPFPKTETSASGQTSSSEVTDPQDYYDALALAEDGYYPIGYNGQWHGGIHFGAQTGTQLDQDNGIRCIADGEVIAWKIDDDFPTVSYDTCGTATYSTGFVLVRHRLELPQARNDESGSENSGGSDSNTEEDSDSLLFYSLYIHLLNWKGYQSDPDKARPAFWGNATYAVGDTANDSNRTKNPHIPEGGSGLNLRDRSGNIVGFAPRGTQFRLGEQRGTSGYYAVAEVTAGSVLPAGVSDFYAYRDELTLLPVVPATIGDVVIPETPATIAAGDLVGHLGQYQRYIDTNPLGSACHQRPLAQIDVFTTENINEFISRSITRAAQLEESSKTMLLVEVGARLVVPAGSASPPTAEQLTAARDRGNGPVAAYARVIPIMALNDAVTEEDGTRWWFVEVGIENGQSASGWVRERDHANVRLCSPWEWPGFEFLEIDSTRPDQFYANQVVRQGHAAPDEEGRLEQQGAAADHGLIFRKLYDLIDLDDDKKIVSNEIRQALAKPWLAQALSLLLIKHESEWSGPMDRWNSIDDLIPDARKKDWEKEKTRIKSLLWWDAVKGNHGLPDSEPLVATNFHPIGLIANFYSRCYPLRQAQELALRVSGGYEGRANLDYHALADNFDGQGTSFGLIQWNFGQGTLGPILLRMYNADATAFENSFPARTNYQDLEQALVNGDQQAQMNWATNVISTNRGGWSEAFQNLGDVPAFQDIQLNAALEYHDNVMTCIRLMRGIAPSLMRNVLVVTYAALYDLCVQQGTIDKGSTLGNIERRHASENPADQVEFLQIVVQERARTASTRWRADAMSRRMGIIQRAPYSASESGHSARRGNQNFHLLEGVHQEHVCEI